jgi:hypothetical protein
MGMRRECMAKSPPPQTKGKKNKRERTLNYRPLPWHNVENEPLISGQLQKWSIISMGLIIQKNKGKTFKNIFFLQK